MLQIPRVESCVTVVVSNNNASKISVTMLQNTLFFLYQRMQAFSISKNLIKCWFFSQLIRAKE